MAQEENPSTRRFHLFVRPIKLAEKFDLYDFKFELLCTKGFGKFWL